MAGGGERIEDKRGRECVEKWDTSFLGRAAEIATPRPPARADRLKIFTLSRKERLLVAVCLGLGLKGLICTANRYYREIQKHGRRSRALDPLSGPPGPRNFASFAPLVGCVSGRRKSICLVRFPDSPLVLLVMKVCERALYFLFCEGSVVKWMIWWSLWNFCEV